MGPNAGKSTEQEVKTGHRKVGRKHTVRFGNVGQLHFWQAFTATRNFSEYMKKSKRIFNN